MNSIFQRLGRPVVSGLRRRGGQCEARCFARAAIGGGCRSHNPCRHAACRVWCGGDRGDRTGGIDSTIGCNRVLSWVLAANPYRQRGAAGFGDDVDLRAGFAAIDRVRSGQRSPFCPNAGRVQDRRRPVQLARDAEPVQHSAVAAVEDPGLGRWMKRRCAVGTLTRTPPADAARRSRLVNIHVAVNTARASSGAVPPPCGRIELRHKRFDDLPECIRHQSQRQLEFPHDYATEVTSATGDTLLATTCRQTSRLDE